MTDAVSSKVSTRALSFFWLERRDAGDFPYYHGFSLSGHSALKGYQWLVVLAGVVLGFFALILPFQAYQTAVGGVIAAMLFPAIPLAALALVAGSNWKALFRPVGLRDLGVVIAVTVLNIVASFAVVLLIRNVLAMNANPVSELLGNASGAQRALLYLKTLPQLLGEEIVSILPFLAILWFCHDWLGISRKASILLGWFGAALFFGAIHLPTYGWNFVQCFLVIGVARIALLTGYVATKNIWVSTGAHILNDWILFTVMVVLLDASSARAL